MALPGLFCLVQVGAHFLEAVVRRFDDVYRSGREGKECDNLLTIIAHLYNFHVVQACLIFDVLRKLVGTFTEKDIELILLMLRNVGFSLRKDDALSLKELITETQARASEAGGRFRDQTRVRASCFLTACAPWARPGQRPPSPGPSRPSAPGPSCLICVRGSLRGGKAPCFFALVNLRIILFNVQPLGG